jgi:RsiW-degrading membrane proteinase PrsW (M82 family)
MSSGSPDRAFVSPLAQPGLVPPAPVAPPAVSPAPIGAKPPRRTGRSAPIWIIGVLVLVLVVLVAYFLNAIGPAASTIGAILAFIPLVVVILVIRLIDRWEPEPLGLLIFAAAWGAIAAVGIALGVDLALTFMGAGVDPATADVFKTVVQAPIVEEVGKGIGLLVIFASARRAFDGPVDGVVYGALIGAGFAFTENIQYFAISLIEGGIEQVSVTFFVRAIMSPFAHVMFTAVTGFALGLAARRGATMGEAFGPWLLGLAGAIALHAFWNGSALFGEFYTLYITAQVPLFIGFILGIVALRREEARLTHARLSEFAAAGWFTVQEVDMLSTPKGRKTALAWAQTLRGDRRQLMREFIRDATELAMTRQRSITGRDPHAAADERALLERTARARTALFAI